MDPSKSDNIGLSSEQRAAMRAVEEEAVLDLVRETVNRLNRLGDRLEIFAGATKAPREECK